MENTLIYRIKKKFGRSAGPTRVFIEFINNFYLVAKTKGLEVSTRIEDDRVSKWEKKETLKILMLSPRDYAGSFFGWGKAVNRYSDVACRQISLFRHKYNYPYDIIFHGYRKGINNCSPLISKLVHEADVLHLKDEFYFYNTDWIPSISRFVLSVINEFQKKNKPIVFTHYGSYARKFEGQAKYRELVKNFSRRIALTPDLNFNWFSGYYVPHSVDLEKFPYSWTESKVISHSPSKKAIKGTNVMIQALKNIPEIKRNWKIDLIEGQKNDECLRRKRISELFFDQAGVDNRKSSLQSTVIGWYGNSAVESMSFGIPTIAHLSATALSLASSSKKEFQNDCPILNTGLDQESMQKTVESYLRLNSDEKKSLSNKTRLWAEEFHGEKVIGRELEKIYKLALR